MISGDFSPKNSDVHRGRELPDDQDELEVTPTGEIRHPQRTLDGIWRSGSQLKYHNLVELLSDRT